MIRATTIHWAASLLAQTVCLGGNNWRFGALARVSRLWCIISCWLCGKPLFREKLKKNYTKIVDPKREPQNHFARCDFFSKSHFTWLIIGWKGVGGSFLLRQNLIRVDRSRKGFCYLPPFDWLLPTHSGFWLILREGGSRLT